MNYRRMVTPIAAAVMLSFAGAPQFALSNPRPYADIRLDLTSEGVPSDEVDRANGGSPSISGSGRFVAFEHLANGLVPGDLNMMSDVFVRDIAKGTLESVSSGIGGVPAIGIPLVGAVPGGPPGGSPIQGATRLVLSIDPSISADGRYVAFASAATNLVVGDVNLITDIFVNDRKTGHTERVSVGTSGVEANGISGSYFPSISSNGRYVSFTSDASNLVSGDENAAWDVFVHDRRTGEMTRVSVSSSGAESHSTTCNKPEPKCAWPVSSISSTGRYVAFDSDAADLVETDTNLAHDVFLHDRSKGTTERVSIASTGEQALPSVRPFICEKVGSSINGSFYTNPAADAISAGGRFVVFASTARNLVPNDVNDESLPGHCNGMDIFVHDLKTGRTERVSVEPDGRDCGQGLPGTGGSFDTPTISGDGRYVAFRMWPNSCSFGQSSAYNPEFGTSSTIMWVDRRTGAVVSHMDNRDVDPAWTSFREFPDLNSDGRYVSFRQPYPVPLPLGSARSGHAFFRRDFGTELGVGDLFRKSDGFRVAGESGAIAQLDDSGSDATGVEDGAEIIEATFAYRPSYSDLYVKIDLESIPGPRGGIGGVFAAGNPALVYGARFTVDGRTYEVRASKTGALSSLVGPAFGLFRCAGDLCEEVAPLHGGYGTVGESIVVAVPLDELGFQSGDTLKDLEAFSALGTYLAGPVTVLDLVVGRHQ